MFLIVTFLASASSADTEWPVARLRSDSDCKGLSGSGILHFVTVRASPGDTRQRSRMRNVGRNLKLESFYI